MASVTTCSSFLLMVIITDQTGARHSQGNAIARKVPAKMCFLRK